MKYWKKPEFLHATNMTMCEILSSDSGDHEHYSVTGHSYFVFSAMAPSDLVGGCYLFPEDGGSKFVWNAGAFKSTASPTSVATRNSSSQFSNLNLSMDRMAVNYATHISIVSHRHLFDNQISSTSRVCDKRRYVQGKIFVSETVGLSKSCVSQQPTFCDLKNTEPSCLYVI